MNFFPDFAPNSRKEWRLLLFQSNLRKQIRKLPKILKFVRIIHYYSKLFTGVLNFEMALQVAAPDVLVFLHAEPFPRGMHCNFLARSCKKPFLQCGFPTPTRCNDLFKSSTLGLQLTLQAVYAYFQIRFRDGAAICGPRRSLICIFSPFLHA